MTQQELELPKGWAKSQFDKCISYIIGGDWGEPFKDKVQDNFVKVRVLRSTELKNWKKERGSTAETRIIKKSSLDKRQLHDGNIILEISGGSTTFPVGRSVLIDNSILKNFDVPIICSNFFRKITLEEFLDPVYASNFLDYNYSTGLTIKFKKQTVNIQNLNTSGYLSSLLLPIPSINEQKRIVSKIEELFSKIDSTKQSLLHAKLQLRMYDHSFQKTIFEELERKYQSKKLVDICTKITDGTHHSPPNTAQGEIPYITAKNIRPRKLDLSNLTYISIEEHNEIFARCNPTKGDVLYTKDGVNLGFAVVNELDFEFSLLSSVALLKPNHEIINPYYIVAFLNNPLCYKIVTEKSLGSAITRIVLRQIKEITIPLPPLEEQEQIVSQLEQGFSLIENSQRIVNSTLQTLETMRMSVLKQAFEGKLVPQDPNDEPASILLEKIKNAQVDLKPKLGRAKNVK